MSTPVEKKVNFRQLLGKSSAFSHGSWEIILKLINVYILEMEDVLFHHNSAVMMPESPAGKSSADGSEDDAWDTDDTTIKKDQENITGVKALALLFKQFEMDPDKRLLITAHTDTSGTAKYNFELSELRALNVLYLLIEERQETPAVKEKWSEVCYEKHKIEDYQQILTYVYTSRKWPCNPVKINNQWNEDTRRATDSFINYYNAEYADKHGTERLPDGLMMQIINDPKKRWPLELWGAVYDLYSEDLAGVLDISLSQLKTLRLDLNDGKFVSAEKKYVACGESFPIDDSHKNNYRSQSNRRVEILLFDKDETPELNCPDEVDKVHKEKECPLWHGYHFVPLYIDSGDLYAVIYHMSFKYYDRIAGKIKNVPDGLKIQAFENGSTELKTQSTYSNGVYRVKVQFKTPLNDSNRKDLHFEFKAENKWIYTGNAKSDPVIMTKTPEEIKELNKPANFTKRRQYYDLPVRWSSRNYWTRFDGDINKGKTFEDVLKKEKKLKPFGDNLTSADKPLAFSLDDIVLLDKAGGTQEIFDHDHSDPPIKKKLSNKSRLKFLLVDEATNNLKLYKSGTDDASCRIPFPKNLIVEKYEELKAARIIFFRDGFYIIADKRTVEETDWESKGFVLGARAAVRHDPNHHFRWELDVLKTQNDFIYTGDFDLHYFHHFHLEGKHPVSFLIYYVSTSFMRDVRDPAKWSPIPSQTDVKKYVDEGGYNAMRIYNCKNRYLDEETAGDKTLKIKTFYFFDERETFIVPDADHPSTPIDTDKLSERKKAFNHSCVTKARQKALGGKSKFLAFVCRDIPGRKHGYAFHNALRPYSGYIYSMFKLHKCGYKEQPYAFSTTVPTKHTEYGRTFTPMTFAHELGHATGQPDEYIYTNYKIEWTDPTTKKKIEKEFNSDDQGFAQYSMRANNPSIMKRNMAPRLHNLWYTTHLLNNYGTFTAGAGGIKHFLEAKKFVVKFDHNGTKLIFNRKTGGTSPLNLDLRQPVYRDYNWPHPKNSSKKFRMELYDVGQDASSMDGFHGKQNGYRYHAVLVVGLVIHPVFQNDSTWKGQDKADRLDAIQRWWMRWSPKFRLVNGKKLFKRIYIHFLPIYLSLIHI